MTNPLLEVTPEMRKAVYLADCEEQGHIFNYDNIVTGREVESSRILDLMGHDGRVPHVWCHRCGKVWLIMEASGENYEDAVTKLKDRLKPDDDFQRRPEKLPKEPSVK